MLDDLKILNGEISLKFDPLNTIYTVDVLENVDALELEYTLEDGVNISIVGNENFKYGVNEVVISVFKEDIVTSYYLYVYKENTLNVFGTVNKDIVKENEEIWEYAVPVISSMCFLLILFTFCLLFRKK